MRGLPTATVNSRQYNKYNKGGDFMRFDLDDIIEIMLLIISSVAVLVVGYFVSLLVLGL